MVLPVTIALFALLLLYAGVHDMTVTDALRALLGRPPKGKLGSLSPVTPTAPVLSGGSATGKTASKALSGTVNAAGQVNPIPGATGGRLDQGFDVTTPNYILAPYDGTVVYSSASDPGWKGGGYVAIQSSADPNEVFYAAEGLRPTVSKGDAVSAGSSIASPANNPYNGIFGNIEIGRANPNAPGQPLAQVISNPSQMVYNFYTWLRNLGAPAATSTGNAGKA